MQEVGLLSYLTLEEGVEKEWEALYVYQNRRSKSFLILLPAWNGALRSSIIGMLRFSTIEKSFQNWFRKSSVAGLFSSEAMLSKRNIQVTKKLLVYFIASLSLMDQRRIRSSKLVPILK